MAKKVLLDQLQIPNPCSVSWDSMIGDDRIRFCEHCDLTVHNISQLTSKQILDLVANSNGRLCVNYYVRPESIAKSPKLHQIVQRASRVAAGAFSATLAFTASTATGAPITSERESDSIQITQRFDTTSPTASVVGTVTDQNGARIPSASVSLSNDQTRETLYTSVTNQGEYRFEGLEPGAYSLRIEAPGFAPAEVNNFYVGNDDESRLDQTLQVESIAENVTVEANNSQRFQSMGGAVVVVLPMDPFIQAVSSDDMQSVLSMISGRDVNMRDKNSGTTALEHATRNANREMVQLLISSGADVNAKNGAGKSVLMMLDNDATSDLLWELINAGAKVNAKDSEGNTPLMEAAGVNNVDLIRTLLEAGAKVNAANKQGRTALMVAASEGLVNNIRALILAGSEINAVDDEGKNALDYAMEGDHAAVVRLLRSEGIQEKVVAEQEKN